MRLRRLAMSAFMALAMVTGLPSTAFASAGPEAAEASDIEIGPCQTGQVKVKIPTPIGYVVICVDI